MSVKRSLGTVHSDGLVTALIYTRVSSDEQAREGVSLDAQLATCREYAARHGWVLDGEYQDIMTGKRDDRPRYQALLAEVRRPRAGGRPVAVVVARLDRLGRKLLERVRCREELKALGVPTHSVREGGEVSDLVANILASVAEEEVRRLGERVSDARRHIIGQGWYYPGREPWGYRLRPATEAERAAGAPTKMLEADPITASFVREAFERLDAGEAVRVVARRIAGLPEAARGGRAWSYPSVRKALSAAVYVARHEVGADEVLARPVGNWPALVDDGTWHRVQARIARHKRMPRQASGRHLLTGLIGCAKCGGRMSGNRRVTGEQRYRCDGWRNGVNAPRRDCQQAVPARRIDGPVLAEVAALVENLAASALGAELRRAWDAASRPSTLGGAEHIAVLQREAATARKRLTDAARLLVDGALDRAGCEALRDAERIRLEAAEAEIARLQSIAPAPTLPPLEAVLREAGSWARILREADVSTQRDVLSVLVEAVIPARVAWATYRPAITWTDLGAALRRARGDATAAAA